MTSQLQEVATRPSVEQSQVQIEPSARWARAFVDGKPVADSKRVLLVFEPRPVYYFPTADVRMDLLRRSSDTDGSIPRQQWTFESGVRVIENVGWSYEQPDTSHSALKDYIAFHWGKMDAWFEEDEQESEQKWGRTTGEGATLAIMGSGHFLRENPR